MYLTYTHTHTPYLSDFVPFFLGVRVPWITIADPYQFGHRYWRQWFGPIFLLQLLSYLGLLCLDLCLQLLFGFTELFLGFLQCPLMICPDLVTKALLFLPAGAQ